MKKLSELLYKYKRIILYIIFGVGTTLVNIVTYFLFRKIGLSITVSSVLSWILAVLFAYVTNKLYVFESKNTGFSETVKECILFYLGRVATLVLDLIILLIFVKKLNFNELVIKILSNVIVIILNYVISKLFVFKSDNKESVQ